MAEIGKTIEEFPKYEVNAEGAIRNKRTAHVLATQLNNSGYVQTGLFNNEGKRKKVLVSRIVASAGLPNPLGLPEVDHLDDNPLNNAVSNLEGVTTEENIRRKKKTIKKRERHGKRPVAQYTVDGELVATYESLADARRKTGISEKQISRVARGEMGRRTTHGFVGKFI